MEITLKNLCERVGALEDALVKIDGRMDEALGGNPHGERMDGLDAAMIAAQANHDGLSAQIAETNARIAEAMAGIQASNERQAELEREQLELLEAIAKEDDEEEIPPEADGGLTEIPADGGEGPPAAESEHNPPAFWEKCLGAR